MRYFIVKYIKQPNDQYNEQAYMDRKIRKRDEDMASIILDYRDKTVIKATMNDKVLPKEFARFDEFFHDYYPETINYLRAHHQPPETS